MQQQGQMVYITAKHHPYYGQALPVVAELHLADEIYVDLARTGGGTVRLPAKWVSAEPPGPFEEGGLRMTWDSVRALADLVTALHRKVANPEKGAEDGTY